MADGAVEEQFPQPIAAAEEAQVAPGRASGAGSTTWTCTASSK